MSHESSRPTRRLFDGGHAVTTDDLVAAVLLVAVLIGSVRAGNLRRRSLEDRRLVGTGSLDGLLRLVADLRLARRTVAFAVDLVVLAMLVVGLLTEPSGITRVFFYIAFAAIVLMLQAAIEIDARYDARIDRYVDRGVRG